MTTAEAGFLAPSAVRSRASGRTPAADGQFPWIVAVNGSVQGSGIRVADRTIITAKHCGRVIAVYAGARVPFEPLFLDPRVEQQRHAALDLQTAALSTNVPYRPAPPLLTDAQLEAWANRPMISAGFGRTGSDRELSYGVVRLLAARGGGDALAKYGACDQELVTTDLANGSLAHGDSGGAILATDGDQWYLAGMILRRHNATNTIVALRLPAPAS